jgi:hypothetical protein
MRKSLFSKVFTLGFVVLVMVGCGRASPTFPTGDFIDHLGLVLSLMPDGRCTLSYPTTGEVLIENGHYSVDGDIVTIIETEQCPPGEGVYRWTLDGDRLLLELIEDNCANRISSFSQPLTRYSQGE